MAGEEVQVGRRLVVGRDYPGSYQGFRAWFPDDLACVGFLEELRWAEGSPAQRAAWAPRRGARLASG